MFNLIITIISIGLIAALALASIYYGGDAFSQGSAKAAASTVVSQAQQISAANVLFKSATSGANATSVGDLNPDYLASIPVLPAEVSSTPLTLNDGSVVGVFDGAAAAAVCNAINEQVGLDPVDTLTEVAAVTAQYGCYTDSSDGISFIYK